MGASPEYEFYRDELTKAGQALERWEAIGAQLGKLDDEHWKFMRDLMAAQIKYLESVLAEMN